MLPDHSNQQTHKQWWAPVWKGLVMDSEAKHYLAMKNAIWLYLYFLLNANRRTGVLMRKIDTISNTMGVTRGTLVRWLDVLRSAGYVRTVNTGRSLTIQVTRWKALPGVGNSQPQISNISNSRYPKYPTSQRAEFGAIPLRIPGVAAAAKETIIKKNKKNEIVGNEMVGGVVNDPRERGLTSIRASMRQELLAQEIAKELNDSAGINLYRSHAAAYPEWLLRKTLAEVNAIPSEQITKGRGALFNHLVELYDKGVIENPGS
jgi:hypothetical protein